MIFSVVFRSRLLAAVALSIGLWTALSIVPGGAFAAAPLVDARLTVALIRFAGTVETNAPATEARPGDVLEYTARYSNRGDGPADALTPTMRIPEGTEYVPTAASPKPTHASLDGATYSPLPLRRKETRSDGSVRDVEVPPAEYRALRWSVGALAAGHEVSVRTRVRVSTPPALASH